MLPTSRAGPLKNWISSGPLYDGSGNTKNNTEKKKAVYTRINFSKRKITVVGMQ